MEAPATGLDHESHAARRALSQPKHALRQEAQDSRATHTEGAPRARFERMKERPSTSAFDCSGVISHKNSAAANEAPEPVADHDE